MQFSNELIENLANLDGVEKLRQATRYWLAEQKVSQKTLSKLMGLSEVFLSQFLNGEKSITAKTYLKLSYLVGQQVVLGSTIAHAQQFGQPVQGGTVDMSEVKAQFNQERSEKIVQTYRNRDESTL